MTSGRLPSKLRGAALAAVLLLLTHAGCASSEQGHLAATRTGDLSLGPAPRGPYDARLTAACGTGGLTADGAAWVQRQPYLQQVTDQSAMLLWTATAPATCSVRATAPDGSAVVVAARLDEGARLVPAYQFVASLAGLRPDTTYCYRIECDGAAWVHPTGFHTAPEPGRGTPVRFVAFGDLGPTTEDQLAVRRQLETVAYDFAVLTGDVGQPAGTLAEFETHFFDVYETLLAEVPFFAAAGNHDYGTSDAEPFHEVFALPENGGPAGRERWYSFDWGDVHVVVLDTERLCPTQTAWLADDLAQSELPWTIVVAHRPPYSAGAHGPSEDVRAAFVPLFEQYAVPLVLLGHDHDYERTRPINGVTYIVTGGGGAGTRPTGVASYTAFSEQVAHFVYLEVAGDTLRAWAIDATGRTFDTVAIPRPATTRR